MEDFGDMGVDESGGQEDSGDYGGYGVEPGNPASADPAGGNAPGTDYGGGNDDANIADDTNIGTGLPGDKGTTGGGKPGDYGMFGAKGPLGKAIQSYINKSAVGLPAQMWQALAELDLGGELDPNTGMGVGVDGPHGEFDSGGENDGGSDEHEGQPPGNGDGDGDGEPDKEEEKKPEAPPITAASLGDLENAFSWTSDGAARGAFQESAGMSRQMWDDWTTHGRPTLEAMAENLRTRNTEAHAERAAGLAAADVNQAFDTEEANFRRNLQRYGVSPTSGRAMSGLRGLSLGRAGSIAGAKTRTRMAEESRLFRDQGIFLDSTGRLASAGLAGTARAAQGLAGIDASERAAALADLNARRSAKVSLEGIAAGERASERSAAATKYAADRNYQANRKASRDSMMWGLVGGFLGGISDRRLKTDVEPVDQFSNGLTVYRFRFHHDEPGTHRHGLMADEVEKVAPQYVGRTKNGYQTIDYDGLRKHMEGEKQAA